MAKRKPKSDGEFAYASAATPINEEPVAPRLGLFLNDTPLDVNDADRHNPVRPLEVELEEKIYSCFNPKRPD